MMFYPLKTTSNIQKTFPSDVETFHCHGYMRGYIYVCMCTFIFFDIYIYSFVHHLIIQSVGTNRYSVNIICRTCKPKLVCFLKNETHLVIWLIWTLWEYPCLTSMGFLKIFVLFWVYFVCLLFWCVFNIG